MNFEPEIFALTHGERGTALWQKIKTRLQELLQTKRELNDSDLDPQKTHALRGEIAALKEIIDWDRDRLTE